MEAQVQEMFIRITERLMCCQQVADIKHFLFETIKSSHESISADVGEWETVSRRVTNQTNTHLHTLTFGKFRLTVTYHYLFDLSSYATILVALVKDTSKQSTMIRKALFLYDIKTQRVLQLDSEIA